MTNTTIIKQVERLCLDFFGVDKIDYYIHFNNRKAIYITPAYCAMKIIADNTNISLAEIGANIRGKNHATVIHAKKTICNRIDTDKKFRVDYLKLEQLCIPIIKQKKKVYIAGSVEVNTRKLGRIAAEKLFSDAENKLIADGFEPVNPCKLFTEYEKTIFDNIDFMERLIPILFGCQAIYMLTDYIESYNAQIELIIAKNVGLEIMFEN
jgi:hypothetical protein